MHATADSLASLLRVERCAEDQFRGATLTIGIDHFFGGQLLGQALAAAGHTVAPGRPAHSLHGTFVHAGDVHLPVDYAVTRVRDGGSFSTRAVTALQDNRTLFTCTVSFHRPEPGFEHQAALPEVPPPEECQPELEFIRAVPAPLRESIPKKVLPIFDKPIEVRVIRASHPFVPTPAEPSKLVWFRIPVALPDDPELHRCLLAYTSDFNLLTTALQPHAVSLFGPRMQVASLDHAIWIHRDVRLDDWLLYVMDSPWAGGARGLTRGSIYSRAGELVAHVSQEGLLRRRDAGR